MVLCFFRIHAHAVLTTDEHITTTCDQHAPAIELTPLQAVEEIEIERIESPFSLAGLSHFEAHYPTVGRHPHLLLGIFLNGDGGMSAQSVVHPDGVELVRQHVVDIES